MESFSEEREWEDRADVKNLLPPQYLTVYLANIMFMASSSLHASPGIRKRERGTSKCRNYQYYGVQQVNNVGDYST